MLTRILDTSKIDMSDPEIRGGLNIDLRRMDRLDHSGRPRATNAYRVVVGNAIYYPNLTLKLQYGILKGEEFVPVGEPKSYSTEMLPFLD